MGIIILNGPYFYKQAQYWLGLTDTEKSSVNRPDQPANVPEMGEPNQIHIPSLDISAPLQYVDEINEDVFQKALQNGVVHYPGTADVGHNGNAYFFGHSSDMLFAPGNYKTVFALLPNIKHGSEVVVSDKSGQIFRYEVVDQFVVNNDDLSVLDQRGHKEKLMTLQTSYPVGTAFQRYIVVTRLKE